MTKDLVETLERKLGFDLDNKTKQRINKLEEEFLNSFLTFIPKNVDSVCLSTSDLSNQLESAVEGLYPVISLDRVYISNADFYLDITRLTNPYTGDVTIGSRPGAKPLEEQIYGLPITNSAVLVDCGAFEGETILSVCEQLEKISVKVNEVYLAVSDKEANKRINNSRKLNTLELFDFFEWIELRDLFGIDGRFVESNKRIFIPYWENLTQWASIPIENRDKVFSLCRNYNAMLLQELTDSGLDIQRIGTPVTYRGGLK